MSSTREHNALCAEILLAITKIPGVYAERYEPMKGFFRPHGVAKEFHVERGVPGVPDIVGWVTAGGCPALWFGHEVKTGGARRNPKQVAFHARAAKDNASATVVHSVADSVTDIERLQARARHIGEWLNGRMP